MEMSKRGGNDEECERRKKKHVEYLTDGEILRKTETKKKVTCESKSGDNKAKRKKKICLYKKHLSGVWRQQTCCTADILTCHSRKNIC